MKLIDQELFEQKKRELLDKFALADDKEVPIEENPAAATASDRKLFGLVVELFAIQRGLDLQDQDVRVQLENYAREKMAACDPNDPRATNGAKMLRLLASEEVGSASIYADDLKSLRKEQFNQAQAERAAGARPNPFNEFLLQLLRTRPALTPEEALSDIRENRGFGLIIDVDLEYIWVSEGKGGVSDQLPREKRYKIKALGTRLSRLRKTLNPIG